MGAARVLQLPARAIDRGAFNAEFAPSAWGAGAIGRTKRPARAAPSLCLAMSCDDAAREWLRACPDSGAFAGRITITVELACTDRRAVSGATSAILSWSHIRLDAAGCVGHMPFAQPISMVRAAGSDEMACAICAEWGV